MIEHMFGTILKILFRRCRMKHNELFSQWIQYLKDLIHSGDFLEEFRVPKHFVRSGKISLENMVLFLLFHSKSPLDAKLDQFREKIPSCDFPKVSKQALSQARYGIQSELFKELFDLSVQFYYENVSVRKLWENKYHIFAIDGSDQEVPSSPSNFEEFGKQSDQKNPDLFWSMGLASMLYDVLEDFIVDTAIEKQFYSERLMASRHLARFEELGLQDNSIVIFDRGYFSSEVYQEWLNAGCLCLMRLKKPSKLCDLSGNDVVTTTPAPDGTDLPCRVLKVLLSTGETEYLITNIMDKELTCESFKTLYFERWKIEVKYLEVKERWKIEEFTGTGVLAVRQDFYITMLHVNLASVIKTQTDEMIARNSKANNTFQYRARRTFIIGKIQRNFIKWLNTPPSAQEVDELVLDASKKRSQVQPGRTCKRKRHTRARKHYNNRKSTL